MPEQTPLSNEQLLAKNKSLQQQLRACRNLRDVLGDSLIASEVRAVLAEERLAKVAALVKAGLDDDGRNAGWQALEKIRAVLASAPEDTTADVPAGFQSREEYERVSRELRAASAVSGKPPPWSETESETEGGE